jgi:nitrogen fixation protein NifZ
MIDARTPKFQWGQKVTVTEDLLNDGSFPDRAADAVLARRGDRGEIVQVGTHVESSTPVYLVEFSPDCVVGCYEEEIEPLA